MLYALLTELAKALRLKHTDPRPIDETCTAQSSTSAMDFTAVRLYTYEVIPFGLGEVEFTLRCTEQSSLSLSSWAS